MQFFLFYPPKPPILVYRNWSILNSRNFATHGWFPCEMTYERRRQNSILMILHYPDRVALDWLNQMSQTTPLEALPRSG